MQKYWQNLLNRIARLKGSDYSIAAGVACGAAVSFTPFVGLHLVIAFVWAWLIRGNLLAAAAGTIVVNPWSFPFIWVSVLYTGRRILGADYEDAVNVNFRDLFAGAFKALINFDFDLFFSDIWPILWPMMVGCIPYCVVVWVLSFYGIEIWLKQRRKTADKARTI